jgi:hypothetical protein
MFKPILLATFVLSVALLPSPALTQPLEGDDNFWYRVDQELKATNNSLRDILSSSQIALHGAKTCLALYQGWTEDQIRDWYTSKVIAPLEGQNRANMQQYSDLVVTTAIDVYCPEFKND